MRFLSSFLPKLLLGIGVFLWLPSHGEGLAGLEQIVAPFPTLSDFLSDDAAVLRYRDALKIYLKQGEDFDPVYAEFIRQIKDVNAQVDNFGQQAWEFNSHWSSQRFSFQSQQTGTGLELKRQPVFEVFETLRQKSEANADKIRKRELDREKLAKAIVARYQLLPEEKLKSLSRSKLQHYRARIGGKGTLPTIEQDPDAIVLIHFFVSELLTHKEDLVDALFSGDADITIAAAKKIPRLSQWRNYLQRLELKPEEELVLSYLTVEDPGLQQLFKSYETALQSMKDFRHIKDARLPPELIARLAELEAAGVQADDVALNLTESENELLNQWINDSWGIADRKRLHHRRHGNANQFFFYELHEDEVRRTLRLKSDASTNFVEFIPSPRPFHAFFAGVKTLECVGGRTASELAPKRWARAALKGGRNFFVETEKDRMEGLVGLTQLETAEGVTYHVMDLMSKALKSDFIVQGDRGAVKYSIFDLFVDSYSLLGSHGLVISDGNSVSANIGGAEVVLSSPAYLEDARVGTPEDFHPTDPMAAEISRKFPKVLLDYGKGGMVFDGMRGDGTKVVQLIPSGQRRKRSREELETLVLAELIFRDDVDDRSEIWKLARESSITLKTLSEYRKRNDGQSAFWNEALDVLLHSDNERKNTAGMEGLLEKIRVNPKDPRWITPERLSAIRENLLRGNVFDRKGIEILGFACRYRREMPELQSTLAALLRSPLPLPRDISAMLSQEIARELKVIDSFSLEVIEGLKYQVVQYHSVSALEVLRRIVRRQPKNRTLVTADLLVAVEAMLSLTNDTNGTKDAREGAADFLNFALVFHRQGKTLFSPGMIQALHQNVFEHSSVNAGKALHHLIKAGLAPMAVSSVEVIAYLEKYILSPHGLPGGGEDPVAVLAMYLYPNSKEIRDFIYRVFSENPDTRFVGDMTSSMIYEDLLLEPEDRLIDLMLDYNFDMSGVMILERALSSHPQLWDQIKGKAAPLLQEGVLCEDDELSVVSAIFLIKLAELFPEDGIFTPEVIANLYQGDAADHLNRRLRKNSEAVLKNPIFRQVAEQNPDAWEGCASQLVKATVSKGKYKRIRVGRNS